MARNEEKHYGRLNRLILLKEKEVYEKAHPKRPRLDLLDTADEVRNWLPSIKRDIDFYLKKSQVVCYSDAHVEECKLKVTKLEKEFKAFVRKISQLTPGGLESTPWTCRPYKRKAKDSAETDAPKEFIRIETPILDEEKGFESSYVPVPVSNLSLMNKPLCFNFKRKDLNSNQLNPKPSDPSGRSPLCTNLIENNTECTSNSDCINKSDSNYNSLLCTSHTASNTKALNVNQLLELNKKDCENQISIVNYDSSDDDSR